MTRPIEQLRRAFDGMDDEGRRFSAVALAVHLFLLVAGYRRLARTPDHRLQGPRWMWRAVMASTVVSTRDGRLTIVPVGVAAFWLLGRRRR